MFKFPPAWPWIEIFRWIKARRETRIGVTPKDSESSPKGKELFSIKISTGNREYFFNVKQSNAGIKYLTIRESSKEDKSGNRIIIFQEHLQRFREGLSIAFSQFEEKISYKNKLEKVRKIHPRAYMKWTEEDDIQLKNDYVQGKSINALANFFQRRPGAIRTRLKKLGLINE